MKLKKIFLRLILLLCWQSVAYSQDRVPRPDFETGYEYPVDQFSTQRGQAWQYIDVGVLIAALSLASWFALKKRSRKGLIWLSVFSLAYFGFFRVGCICAVGSVQNVSLALFNTGYTLPLTALLFFLIPLGFALFYGRVFCAGVCPLGAIQELTGFMSVKLPKKVESILIAIPFIYLAAAILFAAINSQFIICRYDPFIGIFRLNAPFTMMIFGILLLIAGIFVNRPYCRYLCPYGVLLNIFSRFSSKHLSITPAECINCRLCEDACPYDAILPSDLDQRKEGPGKSRKRFLAYLLLIPFFAIAGSLILYNLSPALARVNNDVRLAKEIRLEKDSGVEAISTAAVAFKESGTSEEQLFAQELVIMNKFRRASPWAGLFLGLSLGISLVSLSTRRIRTEYKPHQGKCVSCGRCFKYCPVIAKK
jgi:ferredoxin